MTHPPLYLLPEEINHITGYKLKSKQCVWLKGQRIQFRKNAFGHPIVSRAHWEDALGGPKTKEQNGPDWGALAAAVSQRSTNGRPDQAPLQ